MPEVVLRVAMSCEGCSGAVERILSKTEGAPPCPRLLPPPPPPPPRPVPPVSLEAATCASAASARRRETEGGVVGG